MNRDASTASEAINAHLVAVKERLLNNLLCGEGRFERARQLKFSFQSLLVDFSKQRLTPPKRWCFWPSGRANVPWKKNELPCLLVSL